MNFPFKLIAENGFDVIGFGSNSIDHLVRVREYPAFNSKAEMCGYLVAAGGEAASTMVGLQRLGSKTAYVGRVGSDHSGQVVLDAIKSEGVDITYAETISAAATQMAFIIIDEGSGERTIIWNRDKHLSYSENEAPIDAATRGRILHMTPHDTSACIKMAIAAREKGVVVSLDCDNVFDRLVELLPLVDICVVSADLPEKLIGVRDVTAGLREIKSRYGCALVGATLGASGSIMLCGDSVIETPAFAVPGGCVDTTGAGDAFRAGFLHGLLSSKAVEDSALTANAVAALKCRGDGAWSTLPTIHEVRSLAK